MIYIAAGLAEWDAASGGVLSAETETALQLMFQIQTDERTWGTLDCWPPFESDAYHEATVAAMAAAAAPGWIAKVAATPDSVSAVGLEKLRKYLRTQPPLHDYSRVLLLWAAARMPDLLPEAQRQELRQVLLKHQKSDGSWSIRSFAAAEAWGGGNRAAKLKAEPDFADPPGDGHLSPANWVLAIIIVVAVTASIVSTEPDIEAQYGAWLMRLEWFFEIGRAHV